MSDVRDDLLAAAEKWRAHAIAAEEEIASLRASLAEARAEVDEQQRARDGMQAAFNATLASERQRAERYREALRNLLARWTAHTEGCSRGGVACPEADAARALAASDASALGTCHGHSAAFLPDPSTPHARHPACYEWTPIASDAPGTASGAIDRYCALSLEQVRTPSDLPRYDELMSELDDAWNAMTQAEQEVAKLRCQARRASQPAESEEPRTLPCGCVTCVCKTEDRCLRCGAKEAPACQASRLAGGPRHVEPAESEEDT